MSTEDRLDFFLDRTDQNRFWWFKENKYLPPIYANLSNFEWSVLEEWFLETEKRHLIGECNIPAMSFMLGLIEGNGIGKIVQLGHYAGYSTLLFGWALKRMGKRFGLISFDIDEKVTSFTQDWVENAELGDYVNLQTGDSTDPASPFMAGYYLNEMSATPQFNKPELIFIDSSHQYAQTQKELKLWYPELRNGGFICLHDVSEEAIEYDITNEGGVTKAFGVWTYTTRGDTYMAINGGNVYRDECGLGIIQKWK